MFIVDSPHPPKSVSNTMATREQQYRLKITGLFTVTDPALDLCPLIPCFLVFSDLLISFSQ